MKSKFICLTIIMLFFCCIANAQSGRKSKQPTETVNQPVEKQEEKKDEPQGETKPVKIYRKAAPDAKVAADCHRYEGFTYMKVVLRVTFDASAVVSDVEVKEASGCRAFDEESVDAARRIKFEPAVQNGKPISVVKTVVYQGGIR